MSIPINLASFVLRTLFQITLDVVRSAVRVASSPGIFDEVASCRHADVVRILFLGAEVNDNARVSHDTVFGNICYCFVVQHKD